MNIQFEKIEDVISRQISLKDCKSIFYYGKIVDKHKGNRMVLDTLNPVVLNVLPPFFKFKRFTNESLYNQAMAKLKNYTRSSDTIQIYYDGSNSKTQLNLPKATLFVHLPNKPCDIMIMSYTTQESEESDKKILEIHKREIVESRTDEFIIRCVRVVNPSMYEVQVELLKEKAIKNLLFDLFEDFHYKKKGEEKNEEEKKGEEKKGEDSFSCAFL